MSRHEMRDEELQTLNGGCGPIHKSNVVVECWPQDHGDNSHGGGLMPADDNPDLEADGRRRDDSFGG